MMCVADCRDCCLLRVFGDVLFVVGVVCRLLCVIANCLLLVDV